MGDGINYEEKYLENISRRLDNIDAALKDMSDKYQELQTMYDIKCSAINDRIDDLKIKFYYAAGVFFGFAVVVNIITRGRIRLW